MVGAAVSAIGGSVKQGQVNDKANADRALAEKEIWAQERGGRAAFLTADANAEKTIIIIAIVTVFLFAILMIYMKKRK